MMIEEKWKLWKDTTGHGPGGYYEVSNFGRLKKNGVIINLKTLNSGYYALGRNLIHKVVASLFIPNPDNKPIVDHIDGNRLNNRVDNLRWVSYSENVNNPNTYYKWKDNHWRFIDLPKETQTKMRESHLNSHRVYHDDGTWHMEK